MTDSDVSGSSETQKREAATAGVASIQFLPKEAAQESGKNHSATGFLRNLTGALETRGKGTADTKAADGSSRYTAATVVTAAALDDPDNGALETSDSTPNSADTKTAEKKASPLDTPRQISAATRGPRQTVKEPEPVVLEGLPLEVSKMLTEEKWTRTMSEAYSPESIAQLQDVVRQAHDGMLEKEVRAVCDEYLTHDKDCVPALYISGMLSLDDKSLDMSRLNDLVEIFQRLHKNDVVKMLCLDVLAKDPKNKSAMRTLAACYKEEKSGEMWPLLESIVRLDTTEANAARTLGEHYEEGMEEGGEEKAAEYYKTALIRYIKTRSSQNAKEVWRHLVQLSPQDLDFFVRTKRDVVKYLSPTIAATLMMDLYKHYKDVKNYDVCIDLIKQVLQLLPDDTEARRELLDCYRKKYADVEKLDDYLRASNLIGNFRNVFEAVSDFEKHMAFKAGTYVWHKTWGVGKIMTMKGDSLHINFGRKRGSTQNEVHDLTLQSAVNILTPLSNDHFWVKKATMTHEALKKYVKDNPEAALKTIITSFDNKCDMKKMKGEMVPAVLTANEWASWHTAAKKILDTSPCFGVDPNNAAVYTVMPKTTTSSSKIADEFRAQKQFIDRVETMIKYVKTPDTDKGGDDITEMVQYFMGFLKTNQPSYSGEQSRTLVNAVVSYLSLTEAAKAASIDLSQYGTVPAFEAIYSHITRPREMYTQLRDLSSIPLRLLFVKAIHGIPEWEKEYLTLFQAAALDKEAAAFIIQSLEEAGNTQGLTALVKTTMDGWKDNRFAAVYLVRECKNCDWFLAANVGEDRLLITLINIVDLTFREIENHLNTVENKKINKAATLILFKAEKGDCALVKYMLANGQDACRRMFTLVNDIRQLEPSYKSLLRRRILETYSDFVFPVAEEKAQVAGVDVMYVTAKMLEEKKARVEALNSVELPRVAAEIAEARSQGDLKENAEYKAAQEAQRNLNAELSQLNSAIAKAAVFDPATATSAVASFGTEVTLHNDKTGQDEVIKLFGPWESDPNKGVISYLSPFGAALMDKKVGEKAASTREHDFSFYTVKAIKTTSL